MAKEQAIRISAKGEFGQLRSSLKNLQSDLRNVTGEIDKGARKGGIFDQNQIRALDLYRRRFAETMGEMDRELHRQNDIIDKLHERRLTATRSERDEIDKNIRQREKELDVIRRQVMDMERLYGKRNRESSSYGPKDQGGGGSSQSESGSGYGRGSRSALLQGIGGLGRGILGLAGIGGIFSVVTEAYQQAYAREVNSLDLAQRIRGSAGRSGSASSLYDQSSAIGRRDRMGYSAAESWQFLDSYSRMAGTPTQDQQYKMMRFGRSYGLGLDEVSSLVGGNVHAGGGSAQAFINSIAGSVEQSGMTARIAEVMETNNTLLEQMNTTLKDGSSKQILAYQTTLDRIGLANGMKQLTGANGANIIGGLGGIFGADPNSDWKWIGIQALQRYNPEKYGNMDLFDLEMSFEDGLLNGDNIPAMSRYIKNATGGNEKLAKRILQKWLTDGGYVGSKREASELWDATNGLEVFSEDQMKKLQGYSIDAGANYDENRAGAKGQGYLDTEARYEKALETIGSQFVDVVMGLKETVTTGIEGINDLLSGEGEIVKEILAFMKEHLTGVALALGAIGLAVTGKNVLGGALGGGKGGKTGGTKGGGTKGGGKFGKLGGALGLLGVGSLIYNTMNDDTVSSDPNQSLTTPDKLIANAYGSMFDWPLEMFGINPLKREDAYDAMINPEGWMGKADSFLQRNMESIMGAPTLTEEQMKENRERHKREIESGERKPFFMDQVADGAAGFFNMAADEVMSWFGMGSKGDSSLGLMPEQREALEDFAKTGKFKIKDFSEYNNREFDQYRNDSLENFEMMENIIRNRGRGMEDSTSEAMEIVKREHSGFKSMMYLLFQPVATHLLSLGGRSTAGGGSGGSMDVTQMSGVTRDQLNAKLGGKLAGTGGWFVQAGEQYGIDPGFLAAIAMHETGNGTSNAINSKNNVGGMMGRNGLMSFKNVKEGIDAMASNLKRNYIDQGLTTVAEIQKKYAPLGAANDPTDLNANWTGGVNKYWEMFGGGGNGGTVLGGDSFFNGWQSRVTSRYGAGESFRKKSHGGLDINGEQGDKLDALVGGIVKKIYYDDGGKLDEDGKMNTRPGGTEIVIQMPDGSSYFYSHLSQVNPDLKVGSAVKAGDWIGNMGGDRGKPGSGSSTTGSHLHLGYMDQYGTLRNPEELLSGLGIGDSSIGSMPGSGGGANVSEIRVKLDVSGEGASVLNNATASKLKALIQQVIAENERLKLQINPSKVGYR